MPTEGSKRTDHPRLSLQRNVGSDLEYAPLLGGTTGALIGVLFVVDITLVGVDACWAGSGRCGPEQSFTLCSRISVKFVLH